MLIKDFAAKYGIYAAAVPTSRKYDIYPIVSLTIAYLESNRPKGISMLAEKYNNFHGIQVYPKWKGEVIRLKDNQTGDYRGFCVYRSPQAGFQGFVDFLIRNPRYTKAGVFEARDARDQLKRIVAAGYSETPTYGQTIVNILDKNFSINIPKKGNGLLVTGLLITAGIIIIDPFGWFLSKQKSY